MGHNYSGNHPRFSMAKPSSLKNIGKAITPGAAMGHPGSSLKKGGEPMHASVSSAVKNVLGPDKPHSHSEEDGKVVMDNAMKLKTNQDGGGMLASDPGAAGRQMLYNQTGEGAVKKKKEHKGY